LPGERNNARNKNYFKPEPPPSVDRPKIILFHAWFDHEMKLNNLRKWAGVQGRVQSLACRRRPGGTCRRRLAITVDKCCDWLQQLPHEYFNMSC